MSLMPKEVGSFTTANPDPGSFEKQSDSAFGELEDFMADDEDIPGALQNTHVVQNLLAYSQIRRRDLPSIDTDGLMKKKLKLDDSENDFILSDGLDVSIFPSNSEEKKKDVIIKDAPLRLLSLTTHNALPQQSFHTTLHNFAICEAQSTGASLMNGFDENIWRLILDPPMEPSNILIEENELNSEEGVQHGKQCSSEANSMQQVSSSTTTETGEGGKSHGHDPMLHPMSYNNSEIRPNEPGSSSYTLLTPALLPPDQASSNSVVELNASEDTAFMRVPRSLVNKCQPNGEPEIKKIKAYCILDSMQKNVNVVLARLAEGNISESELCDNVRMERERLDKLEAELQNNAKDVLFAAKNVVPNLPEGADTPISVEGHKISQTVWADAYSKMDLKNAAVCLFEELYSQAEKASSTISGRFCTLSDGTKIRPPKLDPRRLNVIKHAIASMIKKKHTFYYDPKDFVNLKNSEVAIIKGALSQRLNQIKQVKKKVVK